jgi:H+/Cl- antiporter ClcA
VIVVIVVRTALKGIVTGVIVALARIAGETAPLLFTALGNNFWNHNLKEPIAALPLQIFAYAISPYDDWHRQAWAGALVLMALILALNITVRVLSRDRNHDKLNVHASLLKRPRPVWRQRQFQRRDSFAGGCRGPAGRSPRRSPSTSATSASGTASARRSRTSRSRSRRGR